jgi:hypothetical protein
MMENDEIEPRLEPPVTASMEVMLKYLCGDPSEVDSDELDV